MKVYVDACPTEVAYWAEEPNTMGYHTIEKSTVNEAEYKAVLYALELYPNATEILSDSQLVINQLNNVYHIKESRLRALAVGVWGRANGKVKFTWVPREENKAGKLLP